MAAARDFSGTTGTAFGTSRASSGILASSTPTSRRHPRESVLPSRRTAAIAGRNEDRIAASRALLPRAHGAADTLVVPVAGAHHADARVTNGNTRLIHDAGNSTVVHHATRPAAHALEADLGLRAASVTGPHAHRQSGEGARRLRARQPALTRSTRQPRRLRPLEGLSHHRPTGEAHREGCEEKAMHALTLSHEDGTHQKRHGANRGTMNSDPSQ